MRTRVDEKTESPLLALAERCEQATGPDAELEFDIARALKLDCYPPKSFTSSINAALTLVPEGPRRVEFGTYADGQQAWAYVCVNDEGPFESEDAATEALAICAAALRARLVP